MIATARSPARQAAAVFAVTAIAYLLAAYAAAWALGAEDPSALWIGLGAPAAFAVQTYRRATAR